MPILLIHGGAGTIAERSRADYEAGLRAAAEAGYAALLRASDGAVGGGDAGDSENASGVGGHSPALAAVLAAVTSMESNPEAFNAGVGGALTRDGTVELDACVMVSGAPVGRRAGAVAGVTNTPNPVLLADLVRRATPHVLLIGAGAEELVDAPVPNEALLTPRSRAALERWKMANGNGQDRDREHAASQSEPGRPREPGGSNTVGAVALDDHGNLAAATSTGGTTGQWRGRVGDAPLPGLGTYADERVAISCTGKGEAFMEAVTAGKLAAALESGASLEEAVRRALADVTRAGGDGGLIAVTADGQLAVGFNSQEMAYGISAEGQRVAEVASGAFVKVMRLG